MVSNLSHLRASHATCLRFAELSRCRQNPDGGEVLGGPGPNGKSDDEFEIRGQVRAMSLEFSATFSQKVWAFPIQAS